MVKNDNVSGVSVILKIFAVSHSISLVYIWEDEPLPKIYLFTILKTYPSNIFEWIVFFAQNPYTDIGSLIRTGLEMCP